jgi:phosphohistidine phosphatase
VSVVLSSPAKRARRTAEIVLQTADLLNEVVFDERIYEASTQQLLKVISEIESTHESALLVGHNPGFEELLACLTDRAGRMPTASLAAIELDISNWSDIAPRSGELSWLITPKDLKS